jgi:hypothetical protein
VFSYERGTLVGFGVQGVEYGGLCIEGQLDELYRGTSLIRKRPLPQDPQEALGKALL